jgi:hypothetical protein
MNQFVHLQAAFSCIIVLKPPHITDRFNSPLRAFAAVLLSSSTSIWISFCYNESADHFRGSASVVYGACTGKQQLPLHLMLLPEQREQHSFVLCNNWLNTNIDLNWFSGQVSALVPAAALRPHCVLPEKMVG